MRASSILGDVLFHDGHCVHPSHTDQTLSLIVDVYLRCLYQQEGTCSTMRPREIRRQQIWMQFGMFLRILKVGEPAAGRCQTPAERRHHNSAQPRLRQKRWQAGLHRRYRFGCNPISRGGRYTSVHHLENETTRKSLGNVRNRFF